MISGFPFLLSGLVKCRACSKGTLTGRYSINPRYPCYVCQILMKRDGGACNVPRLNARPFEKLVVERNRSSCLTESCVPDLVKLADEEIDGVVAERRKRILTIEADSAEVKRPLAQLWRLMETCDKVDVAELSARIR